MNKIGYFKFSAENVLPVAWQVMTNPYIMIGLCFYFVSLVLWLMVLSRVDVSFAYPMLSLGYIITPIAAHMLFKEPLPAIRMIATAIIIFGVYLVAKT